MYPRLLYTVIKTYRALTVHVKNINYANVYFSYVLTFFYLSVSVTDNKYLIKTKTYKSMHRRHRQRHRQNNIY